MTHFPCIHHLNRKSFKFIENIVNKRVSVIVAYCILNNANIEIGVVLGVNNLHQLWLHFTAVLSVASPNHMDWRAA